MIEVFRDSGFEVRSKIPGRHVWRCSCRCSPSAGGVASAEERQPAGDGRVAAAAVRAARRRGRRRVARSGRASGGRILDALVAAGFQGPIYPINPHAAEVDGLPAYASARELPPGVDLAIVAVPRRRVLGVVDDCAAAGVKSLVVITAGFAEVGDEGRALQEQLVDKVRGYGMRMVGPNCMGLLNTNRPSASMRRSRRCFRRRDVSPSRRRAARSGWRFSRWPPPAAVGLSTIRQRRQQGRRLGQRPAGVLGRRPATRDHPAVSRIVRQPAALRPPRAPHQPNQADRRGQGRADARRLARGRQPHRRARGERHRRRGPVPPVRRHPRRHDRRDVRHRRVSRRAAAAAGRRVAIVTNAGGPGILAVDACVAAGLTVAEFSARRRARAWRLSAVRRRASAIPWTWSRRRAENTGRRSKWRSPPDDVDALIVIFTPVDTSAVGGEILAAIRDGIARARRAGGHRQADSRVRHDRRPAAVPLASMARPSRPTRSRRTPRGRSAKIAAYAGWRAQPPGLFWGFDDCASTRRGSSAAALSSNAVTDGSRRRTCAPCCTRSACRWRPAPSRGPPTRRRRWRPCSAFRWWRSWRLRRVVHKSDIGARAPEPEDRRGGPEARSRCSARARRTPASATRPTAC